MDSSRQVELIVKGYKYFEDAVCKDCGLFWRRPKSIPSRQWKGRCHRCARIEVCKRHTGTKRSDEHRRKTGIASTGRRLSEKNRQANGVRFSGPRNPKWNPDRELVRRNEMARRELYSLIHNTLKRFHSKKKRKSVDLLGYSAADLYADITSKLKPGMSWDQRGLWHIDHIKPVSRFIEEGIADCRVINALSNLQPLWAAENLTKSDNWTVAGK